MIITNISTAKALASLLSPATESTPGSVALRDLPWLLRDAV